ncbi:hypothetical protein BJ742DRAFT_842563 [Cladochytrium replicatum]|nr:hypothetical protein BJ742DRAFT_842563 [Cladochytrium replicatum]
MPSSFQAFFPSMNGTNETLPSYNEVPTSPGASGAIFAQDGPASASFPDTPNVGDDFGAAPSWTSHLTAFADPTGNEGSFRALFMGASGSGTSKNMFRQPKWWATHLAMRFNAVVVEAMTHNIKIVRLVVRSAEFAFTGVPPELGATPGLRGFWNDLVSCYIVWGTSFLNDFVEHSTRLSEQYADTSRFNRDFDQGVEYLTSPRTRFQGIRFPKNSFAKYVFLGVATSGESIGQTVPLYQVSNIQPLSVSVQAQHNNMGIPLNSTTHDGRRLAGHLGVMDGSVLITLEMPALRTAPGSTSNR